MQKPPAPEMFVEDVINSTIDVLGSYSSDTYFQEAIAKSAIQSLVWGLIDKFNDPAMHEILADDLETLAGVVRDARSRRK